jgi:hypothetical protein
MKIYSCPKEVPAPQPDFSQYDHKKEMFREEQHQIQLKAWLISQGYTGKYTGEIVSFGVADGSANYMVADGSKSFLIHLPYGDAYQYRGVEFMPKKEIVRIIESQKKLNAIFAALPAKKPQTT